jgi:hypothetical protein
MFKNMGSKEARDITQIKKDVLKISRFDTVYPCRECGTAKTVHYMSGRSLCKRCNDNVPIEKETFGINFAPDFGAEFEEIEDDASSYAKKSEVHETVARLIDQLDATEKIQESGKNMKVFDPVTLVDDEMVNILKVYAHLYPPTLAEIQQK